MSPSSCVQTVYPEKSADGHQVFDGDFLGGAVQFKVGGIADEAAQAGDIRYTVRIHLPCRCAHTCWQGGIN